MTDLFTERKQRHFKRLMKYWRLVFNDHFVIALFFLFGALAYQYAQWLPTIQPHAWWGRPLVLIWMVVITQFGRLATLVEAPDPLVLLPQTSAANGYFEQAIRYSAWRASLISLAGLLVAAPLILRLGMLRPIVLVYVALAAVAIKLLWLYRARQGLNFGMKGTVAMQWGEPLVLWAVTLFAPLVGLALSVVLALVVRRRMVAGQVDWQKAIAKESQRLDSVYRFFNLFTDVPNLTGKIKRRRYLDPLTRWLAAGEGPWSYLYGHGVVRNTDVGNLVARLTLVAMVITYFTSLAWLNTVFALLFVYLVASQLMPFYQQYDQVVFTHLFPVDLAAKRLAFNRLMNRVMLVVAGLIVLASWSLGFAGFTWAHRGINLVLVAVEVWWLNRYYLRVRLKKSEEM